MQTKIVIGLGYGDEGKGVTTDALCRRAERPLVVRFSGGHQAGHTVVSPDGRRHVFSNFGAGTLSGAATFWSRHCTFNPVGFAAERAALVRLGVEPNFFVDPLAPVTTPYDVLYNRHLERGQRHGSCGLGFGATVARHEGPAKLHAMDLPDDFVLGQKLPAVAAHYARLGVVFEEERLAQLLDDFHRAVTEVRSIQFGTRGLAQVLAEHNFDQVIFEGSQGLLLDQEVGYFPHVTRAYVSTKNALELLQKCGLPAPEVYYVTRAYQTRHGNGPLTNEHLKPLLRETPEETNVFNEWQGEQRRSLLDVNQLRFALTADAAYSYGLPRHLVVTCLDQLAGPWLATDDGRRVGLDSARSLAARLGGEWQGVWENRGVVAGLG